MTLLAANRLSDDYEYAIVYWGQSNARCWGHRDSEGWVACPWLIRDPAGQNVTINQLYFDPGTTPADASKLSVGEYVNLIVTETCSSQLLGGEFRFVRYEDGRSTPVATAVAGVGTIVAVSGVTMRIQITTEAPIATSQTIPFIYSATPFLYSGMAVKPLTFEQFKSYQNVRVLHQWVPETPGSTPAGSPTALGYTWPTTGTYAVSSWDQTGAFLPFTFEEGVQGFGASGTGTVNNTTFTAAGSPGWTTNIYVGATLLINDSNNTVHYSGTVTANTSSALTVTWIGSTPANGSYQFEVSVRHWKDHPAKVSPGYGFRAPSNEPQPCTISTVGQVYNLPRNRLTPGYHGIQYVAGTVDTSFNATGYARMSAGQAGNATATGTTTLSDTTQSWVTDEWVGSVVVCDSKTATVTSNSATVLTMSGGWSGGGTPSVGPYALIETAMRVGRICKATLTFDHQGSNDYTDGKIVTLIDSYGTSKTFQFKTSGPADVGKIKVTIGANPGITTDSLVAAINAAAGLRIYAAPKIDNGSTYLVNLAQMDAGSNGIQTVTTDEPHMTKTDFAETGSRVLQVIRLTSSVSFSAAIGRMQPDYLFRENEYVSMDLWPATWSGTGPSTADLAKRWTVESRTIFGAGHHGGILNLIPAEGQTLSGDNATNYGALYLSVVTKKVAKRNIRFGAQLETGYRLSQALGRRINIIHLGINSSGQVWRTGPNAFGYNGTIGWWDWTKYLDWTPSDAEGNAARLKMMIQKMAPAALLAEGNTKPLKILGVVGYQGEGDAISSGGIENFPNSFPQFVSWIRSVIYDAGMSLVDEDRIPVVQAKITHTPWEWSSFTGYGGSQAGDVNKVINSTFTALDTADAYFKAFDPAESNTDKLANSLNDLAAPGGLQYKLNGTTAFGTDPLHFNGYGEAINAKSAATALLELHNLVLTPVTTAADILWKAVKEDYDADGLVTLTNIRDRSATTIDDIAGIAAAQAAINLWPAYAQCNFDPTNLLHVEAGELATIAVLWRRGGSASKIEQVKWDEVWGDNGIIAKIRQTGPRGRGAPKSNSGVSTAPETDGQGGQVRGWSDRESMPVGLLSQRLSAQDDG